MINIQKITRALILLLAVGTMLSCDDDDNVEPFEVIGDVFTVIRTTDGTVDGEKIYARSYYAYGNQPMDAAIVSAPDAGDITLEATSSLKNTFAKEAEMADFSTDAPTEGNYLFDVLFQDVPYESSDILEFYDMPLTTIASLDMSNEVLTVEWETNDDAEAYMIRLLDDEGNFVFGSALLSPNATELPIAYGTAAGTWMTGYPNVGDEYKVELHSFTFDMDAGELDYSYHIQEIAITEDAVIWQ